MRLFQTFTGAHSHTNCPDACHYLDIHSLSIISSKYWVQMSVWQGRQGCAMHMQIMYALLSRRIENTEKHTLMLLHFIFFVMFLQAWKINTQNTHCGICGSKKLLFVFPWFLHDDDTVNYGFSCWQRDCGAQRERAINWWGICKQFTKTMEQSGQLILTIPGLWPITGASAPFLKGR